MNYAYLQNFLALDRQAFALLMRELGYGAGACYLLKERNLTMVLDSGPEGAWPACVGFDTNDYTPKCELRMRLGWARAKRNVPSVKLWPKACLFYFPDQEFAPTKLIFALQPATRALLKLGTLDGPLEATAKRIAQWADSAALRSFVSEVSLDEQLRRLTSDIQTLVDHELRTPLAAITGFSYLIGEASAVGNAKELERARQSLSEYRVIIDAQAKRALNALEKITLALRSTSMQAGAPIGEPLLVDLNTLVEGVCQQMRGDIIALFGGDLAARTSIRLTTSGAPRFEVRGLPDLIRRALWEVLQNAVAYAAEGHVNIHLYTSDHSAVVDVEDDGHGVSLGSEELIFTKFYQDPATLGVRRGMRGLGLGLYLARHIVEQHGGQLLFVRGGTSGRNGVFRFILPLTASADEAGGNSGNAA